MQLRHPILALGALALVALPAAAAPTRDQRRCLDSLNAAAARVGKAVASTTVACVRAAARDKLADGGIAACIAADRAGRIAGAKARTTAAADHCRVLPAFGGTDPSAINAAFSGLCAPTVFFGTDVDAAII